MDLIKESDFRKEIKTAPRGGYLLFGEEDYLKSFAIRTAREVLCPDPTFSFFNEMKLDAVDFTPDKLLDALMPLPMMADKKLVTLNGLNFNTMRAQDLDELCKVLETLPEYDYNVLIVNVAADCLDLGYFPKKPSSAYTKLSEHLVPVYFERCTSAKLAAWVQKHFVHYGVEASPALCAAMSDYCGHSMFILANEIEKLSYYTLSKDARVATEEDMRQVCTPVNEYDAFAFTNAIMDGQHETALGILADYRMRRVDPIVVLGEVTTVICNLMLVRAMTAEGATTAEIATVSKLRNEYKVKIYQRSLRNTSEKRLRRALDACAVADASLKQSSSSKGYAPLERLICTL